MIWRSQIGNNRRYWWDGYQSSTFRPLQWRRKSWQMMNMCSPTHEYGWLSKYTPSVFALDAKSSRIIEKFRWWPCNIKLEKMNSFGDDCGGRGMLCRDVAYQKYFRHVYTRIAPNHGAWNTKVFAPFAKTFFSDFLLRMFDVVHVASGVIVYLFLHKPSQSL